MIVLDNFQPGSSFLCNVQFIEHYFIRLPPDSTLSEDAGIKPTIMQILYGHSELPEINKCITHRVNRVPGILSSRPNWLPVLPHSQASVSPPGSKGGGTLWYSRCNTV
jgi:hypothetical protein